MRKIGLYLAQVIEHLDRILADLSSGIFNDAPGHFREDAIDVRDELGRKLTGQENGFHFLARRAVPVADIRRHGHGVHRRHLLAYADTDAAIHHLNRRSILQVIFAGKLARDQRPQRISDFFDFAHLAPCDV